MSVNRLNPILVRRRQDVARLRQRVSETEIERRAARRDARDRRDFSAALAQGPVPRIIAEFKRASPSCGVFSEDRDPAGQARCYARGGAAALSVLTEPHGFHGRLDDLRAARAAVDLPVLRKDFLFCRYQVFESAACGADAVLLIVRILDDDTLGDLMRCARENGLDALVEVHDADDLARARRAGAGLIGINNRDLSTFDTDGSVACRLAAGLETDCRVVAASGIHSRRDVRTHLDAGIECLLIGEVLMRAPDPAACLRMLRGVGDGEADRG